MGDVMLCFDCPKWAKEYIAFFGAKTKNTLKQSPQFSPRRNSIWAPACYDHTDTLCLGSTLTVDGHRLAETARDWFFNDVDISIVDGCDQTNTSQPCNPACHSYVCSVM